MNPEFERARKAARATPGLRGEVILDFPGKPEGPCVACGSWAYTSYQGRPIHMTCAGDLALVLEMTKRHQRLAPGARPLPEGAPRVEPGEDSA